MIDVSAHMDRLALERELLALECARADWWRRSALGTWAVNLLLSGVIAYLLLFR